MNERIVNRCPACGNQTLFIGRSGWLTCSWLKCPNPIVGDYLNAARALTSRVLSVSDVAALLRAFQDVKAGRVQTLDAILAELEQKPVIH